MFRPKTVLLTSLFVLISSFLFDIQLRAQSREATNLIQKRFEISFGGGWGLYGMKNSNKHYIDEFAKDVGIFDDHNDNGPTIFGEIGYFVSPNVSANPGVTYLHGRIGKKSILEVTDYEDPNKIDSLPWEGSLTTTMTALHLRMKYHLPVENIDLFFSGGTAWGFGKCVLKSTLKLPEGSISEKYPYVAQGIGFLASTGASYNLNKTISVGAEVGYRHFATGDLKDKNGEIWVVEWAATPQKMNLDFSGPFILGSLSIRL